MLTGVWGCNEHSRFMFAHYITLTLSTSLFLAHSLFRKSFPWVLDQCVMYVLCVYVCVCVCLCICRLEIEFNVWWNRVKFPIDWSLWIYLWNNAFICLLRLPHIIYQIFNKKMNSIKNVKEEFSMKTFHLFRCVFDISGE